MSKEFIQTISELNEQRYIRQLQRLIDGKIPCGVFFGFESSENLPELVAQLKNSGFNLTCVIATDESFRESANFSALPIVTLEELPQSEIRPQSIIYVKLYSSLIFTKYFSRLGISALPLLNTAYMENLYNFYISNLSKLFEVYNVFADEESKKVFLATIKGRLTQVGTNFRFAAEPHYFLNGFLPENGEVAIDGGAFDGDTAKDFAQQGAEVYAFEMDSENYKNCLERAKKYNFTIENLGLSDKESTEYYSRSGAASRKLSTGGGQENEFAGQFIDLDTYVDRKNLSRVDYIKLDIEGAELSMLRGAKKTVSRRKPKMAISAYHKPEDLWTLADFLRSLRPDYEFRFRHYISDVGAYGHDELLKRLEIDSTFPIDWEMVLYCR